MSRERIEVYVHLLDESVEVWRPVQTEHVIDSAYRILDQRIPPDESWEFVVGDVVRCESQVLDGDAVLVAVEKVG